MNEKNYLTSSGNRYKNPYSKGLKHGFFDVLLWKSGFYKEKIVYPPKDFKKFNENFIFNQDKPSVTWISHSCFLIQGGINILTDPVWSNKCSPISFIGPSRLCKPAIPLEELPQIDFVFISHNHYDHLDKKTVKDLYKLFPNIIWIVPEGVKKWFYKNSIYRVFELSWWQTLSLQDITITSVPAQHFSGRYIFDYNKSLWSGYVMELTNLKKRIYFAGDTGYNPYDFKEIGKKWSSIDLSLIPIGCYIPRWFMKPVHIDPFEAVQIHQEVNSNFSIAMHWSTFHLSDEPTDLPPFDLSLALKQAEIEKNKFVVLRPGINVNW
jgi:N-acyl-phosphatidylethanolamine-hydrolysing phospholipase D